MRGIPQLTLSAPILPVEWLKAISDNRDGLLLAFLMDYTSPYILTDDRLVWMTAFLNEYCRSLCSVRTEMGSPLTRVTKFACFGKISNVPCEFTDETDAASPSQRTSVGVLIFTCKTSFSFAIGLLISCPSEISDIEEFLLREGVKFTCNDISNITHNILTPHKDPLSSRLRFCCKKWLGHVVNKFL